MNRISVWILGCVVLAGPAVAQPIFSDQTTAFGIANRQHGFHSDESDQQVDDIVEQRWIRHAQFDLERIFGQCGKKLPEGIVLPDDWCHRVVPFTLCSPKSWLLLQNGFQLGDVDRGIFVIRN